MNPDAVIRAVLIMGAAGMVFIIAALLFDFFFTVIRDDYRRHRVLDVLTFVGIALIFAALIINFIFIFTR